MNDGTFNILHHGIAWGSFPDRAAAVAWADEKIGKTGWMLLGPSMPLDAFIEYAKQFAPLEKGK